MIKPLVLVAACSVLSGACQPQYAEDAHTLLDITVHDGSTAEFLALTERAARRHRLTVDAEEFPESRHHIYAQRLEGREFAVSVTNPHRPQEFILATYLVAGGDGQTPSSERQFVAEVVDEVVAQDLGHVSPRSR